VTACNNEETFLEDVPPVSDSLTRNIVPGWGDSYDYDAVDDIIACINLPTTSTVTLEKRHQRIQSAQYAQGNDRQIFEYHVSSGSFADDIIISPAIIDISDVTVVSQTIIIRTTTTPAMVSGASFFGDSYTLYDGNKISWVGADLFAIQGVSGILRFDWISGGSDSSPQILVRFNISVAAGAYGNSPAISFVKEFPVARTVVESSLDPVYYVPPSGGGGGGGDPVPIEETTP
jgi:hypothetical protein